MNEDTNQQHQPVSPTEEKPVAAASVNPKTTKHTSASSTGKVVGAVLLVALLLLGVLFFLEKEGRSSTSVFGRLLSSTEEQETVAMVNGEEITNGELVTSIDQFSQMAALQGVDTATTEAELQIRQQALEVLINTELLRQSALEQGLTVSDEELEERVVSIAEELGGEDVLSERMEALGVSDDRLQSDVREELLIQKLLDKLFEDETIAVNEEEIQNFYDEAIDKGGELPEFDEIKLEIKQHLIATKEQSVIDAYIAELKAEAEIDMMTDTE